MSIPFKTTLNYSPNFSVKKRSNNRIKFLVYHYTGMKSEKAAIKRLTNIQSEVACHYFVKNNGEIITIVPDKYIAWHAGVSEWKKYKFLNQNSIGIEISNPGHQFGYKKFSLRQINSIIKLSKFLIKKYKINKKNILGHSDIAPLRKKDPGENFPWEYLAKKNIGYWHQLKKNELIKLRNKKCNKISNNKFFSNLFKIGYSKNYKKKNEKLLIKAFQRRFRPHLINGIIDQECLILSKNLI
tara:strand:+ start:54 stop:776 length:723 start_codon:yes stop_codon:yes gene_type:complete